MVRPVKKRMRTWKRTRRRKKVALLTSMHPSWMIAKLVSVRFTVLKIVVTDGPTD